MPDSNKLEQSVEQLIDKLCNELKSHIDQKGLNNPYLVGILTGGYWLAECIKDKLKLDEPIGSLNIAFYRDDFSTSGFKPKVSPSELPLNTENRHIILIDDVIMSGRTIRAALNELFDFGRPASVTLTALVDINHRELPIHPDVCGEKMVLAPNQRIKLSGPKPLKLMTVENNN